MSGITCFRKNSIVSNKTYEVTFWPTTNSKFLDVLPWCILSLNMIVPETVGMMMGYLNVTTPYCNDDIILAQR